MNSSTKRTPIFCSAVPGYGRGGVRPELFFADFFAARFLVAAPFFFGKTPSRFFGVIDKDFLPFLAAFVLCALFAAEGDTFLGAIIFLVEKVVQESYHLASADLRVGVF
jgi:hypothetical protein